MPLCCLISFQILALDTLFLIFFFIPTAFNQFWCLMDGRVLPSEVLYDKGSMASLKLGVSVQGRYLLRNCQKSRLVLLNFGRCSLSLSLSGKVTIHLNESLGKRPKTRSKTLYDPAPRRIKDRRAMRDVTCWTGIIIILSAKISQSNNFNRSPELSRPSRVGGLFRFINTFGADIYFQFHLLIRVALLDTTSCNEWNIIRL